MKSQYIVPIEVKMRIAGEFGGHLDIEDLRSPDGYDAGLAFFLIFGRHRYICVWDYLVLIG
jgi:hypothetical protein